MQLKKAQRKQVKLKMNLSGPQGSGKTWSALLMAYGLVGDWSKITVIDAENGSASLYTHLGEFNTVDLAAPFSPENYMKAIDLAILGDEKEGIAPAECIIIDSASHEWAGPGGCLELNDKLAQMKYKGNTWSAWNETTPRHETFVQKLMQTPVHIITCTRSKVETVMGEDKKVKKVGMKDIQRDGWEYEFTVALSLDKESHAALVSKDRTNLFEGKDPFVISEATGKMILDWCNNGITPQQEQIALYQAYKKIIDEAPVLTTEEQAKFLLDKENVPADKWPIQKLNAAIERIKTIITERAELAAQN